MGEGNVFGFACLPQRGEGLYIQDAPPRCSMEIIKNRVNRHLIEIIEFCLKIYGWVGGCVGGLLCGSVGGGHAKSLEIQ